MKTENWIEVAKKFTAEYAKTHKGRNELERRCIRDGYLIIEANKLDKTCMDDGRYLFALSKNTSGSGKNFVPICCED